MPHVTALTPQAQSGRYVVECLTDDPGVGRCANCGGPFERGQKIVIVWDQETSHTFHSRHPVPAGRATG